LVPLETLSKISHTSQNQLLSLKTNKVVYFFKNYYFNILKIKIMLPTIDEIRKILFWDTDFNKIDWIKSRYAIIKRILESRNATEISEIKF